ncbi:hypothetical protein ACQPYE_18555 [Actinosynnema sp. CA-299493]
MSTPPAAGGQGFVFDPNGIEVVISDWMALADDLAEDDRRLETLRDLNGPGDEFSSTALARRTVDAVAAFKGHVGAMSFFAEDCITRLAAARDEYLARDRGAADAFEQRETS